MAIRIRARAKGSPLLRTSGNTLKEGFTYGYLIVEDDRAIRAIQPYFLVDQDLLAGMSGVLTKIVAALRRLSPRFMRAAR